MTHEPEQSRVAEVVESAARGASKGMGPFFGGTAVGVIAGIAIGMGLAAFFVSAPLRTQRDAVQEANVALVRQVASLEVQLQQAVRTIDETTAGIQERGTQNSANLAEIRESCRSEGDRAIRAGIEIARLNESSRRTADAVSDLAAQCPPNQLIGADSLRIIAGQD